MTCSIALEKITRNPKQPRQDFPPDYIKELAASIKQRGLIQPITVRRAGKDRFMIVTGECRFRAHKLIGAKSVRCEIVDIDEAEMQLRAIVENMQRKAMNPMEEARAFKSLQDAGYSVDQIVTELGLASTAIVRQRLVLLNLIPIIAKMVENGQLSVAMAFGVAQVSPDQQTGIVRAISAGRLKTSEQVRHAGIAIREAENQLDAFANLPKPTKKDLAALTALEAKIDQITAMVQQGFKNGECIAAQRISPDRVTLMAEKLRIIRSHIQMMEHELRRVAAQIEIFHQ